VRLVIVIDGVEPTLVVVVIPVPDTEYDVAPFAGAKESVMDVLVLEDTYGVVEVAGPTAIAYRPIVGSGVV